MFKILIYYSLNLDSLIHFYPEIADLQTKQKKEKEEEEKIEIICFIMQYTVGNQYFSQIQRIDICKKAQAHCCGSMEQDLEVVLYTYR